MAAYTTSNFVKQNFSFRPPYTSLYDRSIAIFTENAYQTDMKNLRTVTPQIPNKTIYPRTP
jgi:hypothetical protein